MLINEKQYTMAERSLKDALRLGGDVDRRIRATLLFTYGQLKLLEKDTEKTISVLRQCVEIFPEGPQCRILLGSAFEVNFFQT
jgi:hypothetical protein